MKFTFGNEIFGKGFGNEIWKAFGNENLEMR